MWLPALLLALGLLAASHPAEAACLRLDGQPGGVGRWPVSVGAEVRLHFRHSLWGSLVEEHFRVAAGGFELVRLRYAERRLVEFYGHEGARPAGRWWVVEDGRRGFPSLLLRVSRESGMQLAVGPQRIPLWSLVEPDGVVRLSLGGCGVGPPAEERKRHAGRGD